MKKVYNNLFNEWSEAIRLKIIFTNRLTEAWLSRIEALKKEFPEIEFITFKDVEHPRVLLETADMAVGGHFSDEEIEKAKNLKIIFVPWTGVNMLPWEIIRKRNIAVTNTHANSRTVAERAVALSLALAGRIVEFHNDLSQGIWHGFPVGLPESDYWTSVYGKRCSIIGFGNIGKNVARMMKSFDCQIIAFKKRYTDKVPEYADEVTFDLETAVSKGDIIFITLPLTPETKGMFGETILSKMKGKFLVNVSRGEIIDERALYFSLKNGILAGAAIDTWYLYPAGSDSAVLPSRFPIHTFKNVVLSPHAAGVTKANIDNMVKDTMNTIRTYLKNGEILNRVDPNLMY